MVKINWNIIMYIEKAADIFFYFKHFYWPLVHKRYELH